MRMEMPGPRALDIAGTLGVAVGVSGMSFSTPSENGSSNAVGSHLGFDLAFRFAVGPLAFGAAVNAGITGNSGLFFGSPPLSDIRLLFHLGGRIAPRQRQPTDVLFAFGLGSDIVPAPTFGLRITAWRRTSDLGRFAFTYAPFVSFGPSAIVVAPVYFTISGGVGTRSRVVTPR
jgi:hypothetical protein